MNNWKVFYILYPVFSLLLLFPRTNEAEFVSIENLEKFYDLETELVIKFQSYLKEKRSLLNLLKQRYEKHKEAMPLGADATGYVSNPLNVHALLRRLMLEWPLTLALLNNEHLSPVIEKVNLPTKEEYQAVVLGLGRLQQLYQLSTSDMINGSAFQNTETSSHLTASDCFSVGRALYQTRDYASAVVWLKEALAMSDSKQPTPPELLEHLALATCFNGNSKESRHFFHLLYSTHSSYHPSHELLNDHILVMGKSCGMVGDEMSQKSKKTLKIPSLDREEIEFAIEDFDELCRRKTSFPREGFKPLRCHLVHYNEAHLRVRPHKLEELYLDPPLVMFHDVIHPREISYFHDQVPVTRQGPPEHGLMWRLTGKLDKVGVEGTLIRRVEDLTRLVYRSVNITKYAVGGGEGLRHDAVHMNKEDQSMPREEVATLLFYLQEPPEGGEIVFPLLGLSVTPTRGAALLWYNLLPNQALDPWALHGVCPVVHGHKFDMTLILVQPENQCSASPKDSWINFYL